MNGAKGEIRSMMAPLWNDIKWVLAVIDEILEHHFKPHEHDQVDGGKHLFNLHGEQPCSFGLAHARPEVLLSRESAIVRV